MGLSFRGPSMSLVLLHWHFIQIFTSGFNWRFFVSKEEAMIGVSLPRAHLAFNVMGLLSFLFIAAVLIFWPYRYGSYMLPKRRRNKLMVGAAVVYFMHVLPCWMIEFSIIWSYGWFTTIQGVSFVFLTISWILETIGVWYAYVWHMAGFMNKTYGSTVFGKGTNNQDE